MVEAQLKFNTETRLANGLVKNFEIVVGQKPVGRLSMVEFQIERPFLTDWQYLKEIYVAPGQRNKGVAKNIVRRIGNEMRQQPANGILLNAICNVRARNMYTHLGWSDVCEEDGWQVLINVAVDDFVIRESCGQALKFIR
ncbi:GNAT family N-acetyltransferase [Patescibacteria group bacterium]|nr:GNAT family N-acetyltransferase [Patescibacteria group bacterium]